MKRTKSFSADWHILGELELAVEVATVTEMQTWLTEILNPLHLPANFQSNILLSAQDAVARIQANALLKFEHIHLTILAPRGCASKEKIWGFFRIEKVDELVESNKTVNHSIELYLYLEG